MHFVLFGCIWDRLVALRNSVQKWAELLQKFVPRSRVGIFRNERARPTPLNPKLTFWCVSYYLGAFVTVWLPYETRCKTGRKVQKFVPRSRVRIFRNERSRFFHLDPKLMFWCVFVLFGCKIWTVWLPYESRCTTGRSSAKVRATKSLRNISQ